MDSLVFSQSALYQLQQLSKAVRDKTGVRHRLSDPKSVITLLRFSSTSPNKDIFTYFSRFTSELEAEQRAYLQSRGLMVPNVIDNKIESFSANRKAV
jgi:hypothetical protein